MSKKSNKKKVIIAKDKKAKSSSGKKSLSPTVSRSRSGNTSTSKEPLIFGKQNYIYMAAGALLIALGLILMSGGSMPDANTWDTDIIYGFRRTVLAPILIVAGLVVEIVAIFK